MASTTSAPPPGTESDWGATGGGGGGLQHGRPAPVSTFPAAVRPSQTGIGVETRSEEHTSELQSRGHLVCRLLLEKKSHLQSVGREADEGDTKDLGGLPGAFGLSRPPIERVPDTPAVMHAAVGAPGVPRLLGIVFG